MYTYIIRTYICKTDRDKYVNLHTYIHTYVLTYLLTYMYILNYIHTYIHTYKHTYKHTYIYTHMYIHERSGMNYCSSFRSYILIKIGEKDILRTQLRELYYNYWYSSMI